jgi:CRP-like cAMP-binding protein
MSTTVMFEKIGESPLGDELTLKECSVLAKIMQAKQFKDGERLISESGCEHTLFLLAEGELEVLSNNDEGNEEVVYTMTPGEVAGTRAFVDRSPRKATIRSKDTTTVYTMEPDAFESLLEEYPRIVYKVMRGLFRLTHSNLLRMNQESAQLSNYIHKSHGRY